MSGAVRLLTLVQAISVGALSLIMMFPRRRWSQTARLPVAVTAFIASAASLFSHVL